MDSRRASALYPTIHDHSQPFVDSTTLGNYPDRPEVAGEVALEQVVIG